MNELVKVGMNENQEPVVSARELYERLEIKTRFSDWWKSQLNYGFEEYIDFTGVGTPTVVNNGAILELQDYVIKLDMAKELAMVSKSDKGKEVRKYFIQVEKDFNSPEKIMARALQIANRELSTLRIQMEEQKPLVEFAEKVSNTSDVVLVGTFAKLIKDENINVGRNKLFDWLRDNKYLMTTKRNEPYQKYIDSGIFEVKEKVIKTPYGDKIETTTYITGKGQIYLMEKLRREFGVTK